MKGGDKKLSAFPYSMQVGNQCRRESEGMRRNRWDTLWTDGMRSSQTRRCRGMAHHDHAPSTGIKVHTRAGDPPLPQAEPRNDPTTEPLPRGAQWATRTDQTAQAKTTNQRSLKDKHPCLLTLHVNFITKLPTLAMIGAWTSLGGCRGCLLV